MLPGARADRVIRSWKTWQQKVVPSFALEVVSLDLDKDYIEAPALYRELGVRELVIFDPDFEQDTERYRFQVYRQVGKRGMVRVSATNEDRVPSRVLGCFLRAVGNGESTRLRLATGASGDAQEEALTRRALVEETSDPGPSYMCSIISAIGNGKPGLANTNPCT